MEKDQLWENVNPTPMIKGKRIQIYYTFRTLFDIAQIAVRKTIFSFPKNISL